LNERLAVGVVTGTHGVAGALKVKSFSGAWDHLLALREVEFRCKGVDRKVLFQSVRPQPPGVIVRIEGVETPEQARRFIGCEIWVPRRQAAPLDSGEYYEADLCLCSVWLAGKEIGKVRSVLDGGRSQLLEVRTAEGRTCLVPFIEHFVGEVDMEKGRIHLKGDEILP
jgi:16S rRNA processing protein RimM